MICDLESSSDECDLGEQNEDAFVVSLLDNCCMSVEHFLESFSKVNDDDLVSLTFDSIADSAGSVMCV